MRLKLHRIVALGFIGVGAYVGLKGLLPEKRIPLQTLEGSLDGIVALAEAGDPDAALRELDLLSGSEAISLEARSLRASLLVESDPDRARIIAEVLTNLPLGERATDRLVSVWIRLGEPEKAREALGEMPEDRPVSLLRYLAAAKVALYSDRDGAAALRYLERALRLNPQHVETRQILARLHFESERIADQVRAKSITRELDEEGRVPFELLVQILFNQKTPLFADELLHYTRLLLDHPTFTRSGFVDNLEFYRVLSARLRLTRDDALLWRVDSARVDLPEAERADYADFLVTALRANRVDDLGSSLADLETILPGDPRLELVRAVIAYKAGNEQEALRWVSIAAEKGNAAEVFPEAVASLSKAAPLPPAMALELAQRLLDTPGMDLAAALVGANTLLVEADPALRAKIVQQLKSTFANEPEPLYDWLRTQGFLAEAIEVGVQLIEDGKVDYIPGTIDLAVRLGAVDRGLVLMARYENQMAAFERAQASIRLAYGAGRLDEAKQTWDAAWDDARVSKNFGQMSALSYLAASIEDFPRARKAADAVLEQGLILQSALFVFLASGEVQAGDVGAARDYLEKAAIFYPEQDGLRNDASYLTILMGESGASLIARLESIIANSPEVETFRFTLALARLDAGQVGSALKMLESLDFENGLYQPASWGIWAAALFAGGDEDKARVALSRCDADKLLPVERDYLKKYWK